MSIRSFRFTAVWRRSPTCARRSTPMEKLSCGRSDRAKLEIVHCALTAGFLDFCEDFFLPRIARMSFAQFAAQILVAACRLVDIQIKQGQQSAFRLDHRVSRMRGPRLRCFDPPPVPASEL